MGLHTASSHDLYLLACAAATVLLLLLLITRVRLHPALALAVAALSLGVASGMPLAQIPLTFTAGVGNLMGHIALILCLGAVLGQLLAASGGAAALGCALVDNCGPKGLPWALMALGIVVGMPVFMEVGLVLLMPIVAEAARRSGRPPILVGMPLLAGLSIVHGTLPPHPAALLAVVQFHADLGRTILLGLIVGIPAAAIAGPGLGWLMMRRWERKKAAGALAKSEEKTPLFATMLKHFRELCRPGLYRYPTHSAEKRGMDGASKVYSKSKIALEEQSPQNTAANSLPCPVGPLRAASAILLPVVLIFLGSWADALAAPGSLPNQILHFVGSADVALLIAVLVALVSLGPHTLNGKLKSPEGLRRLTSESFEPIANVLVILAAAGGLSGILRDSGAAQATVGLALGARISPLILAWSLAAVVRIAAGSATVAMAVASAVLAPMAAQTGVRPELLVLATGTGSLILSHVNDPGFWLVQSFFKLELKETLTTWSVLETVLSIAGLGATLALAWVIR